MFKPCFLLQPRNTLPTLEVGAGSTLEASRIHTASWSRAGDHMSFTDGRLVESHFSIESQPNSSSLESAQLAVEATRSLFERLRFYLEDLRV